MNSLEDLPDLRMCEALELLKFLRLVPTDFVVGSYSAGVALDLERAGLLRLDRYDDGTVELLIVAEVSR